MLSDGELEQIARVVDKLLADHQDRMLALIASKVASILDARNLRRSPDVTAAERMRRYRAKKAKSDRNVTSTGKRNGSLENVVTLRNDKMNGHELPQWLPGDTWKDFVRHRQAIKHAMNDSQAAYTLKRLAKMHEQGHDVVAVLEQSIANGWQGLFPVREEKAPARSGIDAWLARQERDITGDVDHEAG